MECYAPKADIDCYRADKSAVMQRKAFLRLFVAGLLTLTASGLRADLLVYDNGSVDMTLNPNTMNSGHQVTDEFSLSSATVLDQAIFAEAVFANTSNPIPASVDWSIGTAAFGTDFSGTATVSAAMTGTHGVYTFYSSTFSLPNISLAPGDYFLTLGNGLNLDNSQNDYWAGTPRPAVIPTTGVLETDIDAQIRGINSPACSPNPAPCPFPVQSEASFQLRGTASVNSAPEPATLGLLGLAFTGIGLARRRRLN